jgi:hypothetical protein
MVQRGYPGIHAGMPTPQYLRSASVVNGAPDQKPKRGGLALPAVLRSHCGSEPARDAEGQFVVMLDTHRVFGNGAVLWRGDLSPLGCAAALKQ